MGMLGFVLILLNSHQHEVVAGQIRSNRTLEGKILDVGHVGACGARCGAVSWCLVFLFGAIASGTAMAFLPFSTVFTDVCIIAEDMPLNLGSWMPQATAPAGPSPSASDLETDCGDGGDGGGDVKVPTLNVNQIMGTCWNGGNVYDALNMKETIPINASEMFSGMNSVPSTGTLPEEEFNTLKEVIDNDLNDCATGKSRMQTRLAAIVTANAELEDEIAAYAALLGGIETNSVNVLEAAIDKIKCVKCDFIKATWQDVFAILCKDARSGFGTVAVAATTIGFMSFFTSFAMLVVLRRWGGHGPLKAHDHGDDGLQLAITNKLESFCPCLSHHRKPSGAKYQAQDNAAEAVELAGTGESTTKYTVNVDVSVVTADGAVQPEGESVYAVQDPNMVQPEGESVYAVQDPNMDEVEGEMI